MKFKQHLKEAGPGSVLNKISQRNRFEKDQETDTSRSGGGPDDVPISPDDISTFATTVEFLPAPSTITQRTPALKGKKIAIRSYRYGAKRTPVFYLKGSLDKSDQNLLKREVKYAANNKQVKEVKAKHSKFGDVFVFVL